MEQLVTEFKYYLQSVKMMSANGIEAYVNDVTNYINYLIKGSALKFMVNYI